MQLALQSVKCHHKRAEVYTLKIQVVAFAANLPSDYTVVPLYEQEVKPHHYSSDFMNINDLFMLIYDKFH